MANVLPEDEKQQEEGNGEVVPEADEDVSRLDDVCHSANEASCNDGVMQRETERTQSDSQSPAEVDHGQAPPPHTSPNIDAAHATAMQVSSGSSPHPLHSALITSSTISPSATQSSNDVDPDAYIRGESSTAAGIAAATTSVSVSTSHPSAPPTGQQTNTSVSQPNPSEQAQEELGAPEQPPSSGSTKATNAKGDTVEDPIVISDDEDVEGDELQGPSDSVGVVVPGPGSTSGPNREGPGVGGRTRTAAPTGLAPPFDKSMVNENNFTPRCVQTFTPSAYYVEHIC